MIAYFDSDGRCVEIHSDNDVERDWPFKASVPEGTLPDEVWYKQATGRVNKSTVAEPSIPDVIPSGTDYEFAVPDNCVVEINGERFTYTAIIDASKPRRVNVQIYGRLHGQKIVEVRSYAEERLAEYPTIGDQLDALWKGGADADAMRAKVMAVKAKYPKP